MDRIIEFFLSEPTRLTSLGRALVKFAAAIIFIGAVGRVVTSIPDPMQRLAAQAGTAAWRSLAEIYPDLWTWWVPETLVGCVPAIIVAAIGFRVWSFGRRMIRQYG